MKPKSKLILIMAALSLRKKKICALAILVMLNKVENEDTDRRFSFEDSWKHSLQLRLFLNQYPLLLLPKHFSFDFYYEMLIPLYHINMGIIVLRLLVVPHLLFPFFQYCFSSFLTKVFTSNKILLKLILSLLLVGRNFSGNKL